MDQPSPRRRDVLAGFGLAGLGGAVGSAALGGPAGAQPRRGGTLRVSVEQAPAKLSPLQFRVGPEYLLGELLYSALTRLGPEMQALPDLATSWSANAGLTEWTFNLRRGVVFHDGSPLTARDVAASFGAMLDPATGSPARSNIGPVDAVAALDDHTVAVRLKGAYADLPVAMAYTNAKIVPEAVVKSGLARLDREAVGTGPFRLVSYEPSRLCVVERNPAYYDPARPLLDRVELVLFPDANARTAAQLAGDTDLLLFGQPTEYERLNGAAGQVALRTPSGQFLDIILGCKDKPFDDVRVREALALTLDRDALVELVAEGLGSPGADTPSNAAYLFDAGLPPRKPDIARARALLAEAGYPRGVTATLVASDRPNTRAQLAVAIRAMAKPAGFTINVQTMPHATFLDQVWRKGPFYIGLYNQQPTMDGIMSLLFTSNAAWNETNWNDPEFDRLVEEARRTGDEAARRTLYARAQQRMHDQVPALVPVFFDLVAARRAGVEGFRLHPRGAVFDLDEVWLSSPGRRR